MSDTTPESDFNDKNVQPVQINANITPAVTKIRIFAEDPFKARTEKFHLFYTPVWIAIFGIVVVIQSFFVIDDPNFITLFFSILGAAPLFVIPAIFRSKFSGDKKWYNTYWFKAFLYIFIYQFFGNYFGTEYFFDVLGMVYVYPQITWTLDSALLGSGTQTVPVFMYIETICTFTTYHAVANLMMRPVKTAPKKWIRMLFPLAIFGAAYFWSWFETVLFANPAMASQFYYQDLQRMLTYGSLVYACDFIVSFPVFLSIDENPKKPWSIKKVIGTAFAVSMTMVFLLDIVAHFIGHL